MTSPFTTTSDNEPKNVFIQEMELTTARVKGKGPEYSASRSIINRSSSFDNDRLVSFMETRGIGLVLDIGAGAGGFAADLRGRGYGKRIVSLEPLRARYAILRKNALNDPEWETVQCALGDKDGIVDMDVPQECMPLDELMSHDTAPFVSLNGRMCEDVVMSRISTLLPAFRMDREPVLVHINVPGRERDILHGARSVIEDVSAFHIHVSLQHDASGILTLDEMTRTMQTMTFECVAITPGSMDPVTGTMRHASVTFARSV